MGRKFIQLRDGIVSTGVFGLMFNAEDPNLPHNNMLPFYAAEIGDKRVYCHYTMLKNNQLTDIGKIKLFAMQKLKTSGKFFNFVISNEQQSKDISLFIKKMVLAASDQDVLFFQWNEDDKNDTYFFDAINVQPHVAPFCISDLNISIGAPFSMLSAVELREVMNA